MMLFIFNGKKIYFNMFILLLYIYIFPTIKPKNILNLLDNILEMIKVIILDFRLKKIQNFN